MSKNKEKHYEANKKWYLKNKEKLSKKSLNYYYENKKQRIKVHKKYVKENKEKISITQKKYVETHKEQVKETKRKTYQKHKIKLLEKAKEWALNNPEKFLYSSAKRRAKVKELEFTIELRDIIIPERCPILKIKLIKGTITQHEGSPSLDRIDNNKGYVKDNIHVISYKANTIKNNGSVQDLKDIVTYLEELEKKKCIQ